ncbi:MAG: hypothetical protein ACLGG0_02060 [Bacteriovoracia bacterium]
MWGALFSRDKYTYLSTEKAANQLTSSKASFVECVFAAKCLDLAREP